MPTTGLPGADPGLNERRGCGWSGGPPPENFEFVDAHRHIMGQQEGGLQPLPISPPPHPLVDLSETVTVRLRQ